MDELNATAVVHFFDTQLHRILCGVRGPDHRSTKHARGVSCPACVGLMATRATDVLTRTEPPAAREPN